MPHSDEEGIAMTTFCELSPSRSKTSVEGLLKSRNERFVGSISIFEGAEYLTDWLTELAIGTLNLPVVVACRNVHELNLLGRYSIVWKM